MVSRASRSQTYARRKTTDREATPGTMMLNALALSHVTVYATWLRRIEIRDFKRLSESEPANLALTQYPPNHILQRQ